MTQVWFTSDWHLDHKNMIGFLNRPFDPYDIDHMNDSIIRRFNLVVEDTDKVYFLGDFAFTRDLQRVRSFLRRMNGDWTFIAGNHDEQYGLLQVFKQFGDVHKRLGITCEGKHITLSHYAMFQHNRSHHNSWQLYGHHHEDISHLIQGKKMNVCVDVNNFRPVSFYEVVDYMEKRDDNWDYTMIRDDLWINKVM